MTDPKTIISQQWEYWRRIREWAGRDQQDQDTEPARKYRPGWSHPGLKPKEEKP
jgi:hypothetical protein